MYVHLEIETDNKIYDDNSFRHKTEMWYIYIC